MIFDDPDGLPDKNGFVHGFQNLEGFVHALDQQVQLHRFKKRY